MARIRSFQPGTQNVRVHPSEVDCYFQTVDSGAGEKFLHLTTFGSDDRASSPKSSQSLQLDRSRAAQLIAVLTDAFPGL